MGHKFVNFIDLYFESVDENIEVVKKQLEETGIDYEASLESTQKLIKHKQAKIKLERGKKLREKVEYLLEKVSPGNNRVHDKAQFLYAFRNLEGVSQEDINEIEEDALLLEEIDKYLKHGIQ